MKKVHDLPEGTLFVLTEAANLPSAGKIYMRASGIPNFPTSVAQIIHRPSFPKSCGAGEFPAIVAPHTEVTPVRLADLRGIVPDEIAGQISLMTGEDWANEPCPGNEDTLHSIFAGKE